MSAAAASNCLLQQIQTSAAQRGEIYLFKMRVFCRVEAEGKPCCRRCCNTTSALWLKGHFVTREGHHASTQVSVEACWGLHHHDCFRNWNGLFIGCHSCQEHTNTPRRVSPSDCSAAIIFIFDRSPRLQIFSCNPLVILRRCCRLCDGYYFPAGQIIYGRLPAGF